jgi:hypothetical protein
MYPYGQQTGACAAGQLSTQFGCAMIAQPGQCPQNGQQYAWVNNQCVVGTQNYGQQHGQPYGNNQYPYPNYNYQGAQNQCGPGMVMTQYNCLPQGNCQPGFGSIGGGCVPAIQYNQNGYNGYNGYNPYGYGNVGYGAGFYWGWGR